MVTERLVDHCLQADGDRTALPAHLLDWCSVTIGGAAHADSSPAVRDGIDALCGPAPNPATDSAATLLPSGRQLTPADAKHLNITVGEASAQQAAECLAVLVGLRAWQRRWIHRRCSFALQGDNKTALNMAPTLRGRLVR